eukprot:TRINITY_DN18321_c0_g1_i2.p1 TRINITY_DN18321_c0_g1~~TRINITY_DN18321_c0_g1_i2.p1  ORF type:complete len:181 (-),score=50.05 TRINITY_DN18321_c0_g1_i2:165-707(-)
MILKSAFWLCFGLLDNQVSHLPPRHVASAELDKARIWRHEHFFIEQDAMTSRRQVTEISFHPDHSAIVVNENSADDLCQGVEKQGEEVHFGGKTTYVGTWHTFVTDDKNSLKQPRFVIYLMEKFHERRIPPNEGVKQISSAFSHEEITGIIEVALNQELNRLKILNSTIWLRFGDLDNVT